jgi:O-antigen ligase
MNSLSQHSTNPRSVDWIMLFPQLPGFYFRLVLLIFVVFDRALNANRVSELVIRDFGDIDTYARFQIWTTVVLSILVVISLFTRSAQLVLKTVFRTSLRWITIYLIFSIVSSTWSGSLLLTLFKSGQCFIFFVAIQFAIVGLRDIVQRIRYIAIISIFYLIISYYTYIVYTVPDSGINMGSLHFVVGTTPFVPLLYLMRIDGLQKFRSVFDKFFVPFILIETIFTVYIAVIVAEAANFIMKSRTISRFAGGVIIVALGLGALLMLPSDQNASILGVKKVADIMEGSGRFEVWRYALFDAFPQSPIIGYGFVTGDAVARDAGITVSMGQLHNSFLSALLNLGLIGFVMWIAFLLGTYRMILGHPNTEVKRLLTCAMICVFFQQISGGASLTSILHVVWICHALIFTTIAAEDVYHRFGAPDGSKV